MKFNTIQKHILETAVAHFDKYEVDQPISVLSKELTVFIDEYVPSQKRYFKAMEQLITRGLIVRAESSFAYIENYATVRAALSL